MQRMFEGWGYRFWAIAFTDVGLLRTAYTCTRGNFPLSILGWDKRCTYRRQRHFEPRAIAQRAIVDRENVMSLALRPIDSSYPQKRSNSELPSFFS
ncbi:MAG: hypothetical protein ICV61_19170 [Microcoleus sp. Co-bin12]|nr:hypothetical protein [Microcoleus sp. Co-bin12]